jgi:hypothetical protein
LMFNTTTISRRSRSRLWSGASMETAANHSGSFCSHCRRRSFGTSVADPDKDPWCLRFGFRRTSAKSYTFRGRLTPPTSKARNALPCSENCFLWTAKPTCRLPHCRAAPRVDPT